MNKRDIVESLLAQGPDNKAIMDAVKYIEHLDLQAQRLVGIEQDLEHNKLGRKKDRAEISKFKKICHDNLRSALGWEEAYYKKLDLLEKAEDEIKSLMAEDWMRTALRYKEKIKQLEGLLLHVGERASQGKAVCEIIEEKLGLEEDYFHND